MDLKRSNILNWGLVLVWLAITVFTMFHHEMWRDETQVWCLVRDCGFFEMISKIQNEGHPLTWYLLLYPLAKMGLPVFSMQIVSLLLVFAAVVLIVFKSPFSFYMKILTVFSSGMLYFLPIISRNYALIPLILFLLASIYKKRKEKPLLYTILVILLSNTHSLMFAFSLMLAFIYILEIIKDKLYKENVKFYILPVLFFVNFISIFLFFYHTTKNNVSVLHYAKEVSDFITTIDNFVLTYFQFPLNEFPTVTSIFFYSLFFIFFLILFKIDKKLLAVLAFSVLYFFIIFWKVWFSGIPYQKAYILILIVLFCCWVLENKNKWFNFAVSIFLLFSIVPSYFLIRDEIKYPFSSGKQIADYIKSNLNNEDTFIVLGWDFSFTSIAAYLPKKKFFSYFKRYYYTYFNFNEKQKIKTKEDPDCKYYIVHSYFELNNDFEKIYETDTYNSNNQLVPETFILYRKKDNI